MTTTPKTTTHGVEIEQMVVNIAHLDSLLNLTGEIIINSTNLDIIRKQIHDSHTSNTRISQDCIEMIKNATLMSRRISQDLHNLVMDVRLIKIKEAFQRFRRPVRSISKAVGKEIQLVIEGEDTPIDKTIEEKICNPLDHLIRNSIDHGIEDPLDRKKAGKPVEGLLKLKAYQKQKATYIEVSDDGRGIDPEKIIAKAVDKGLIRQEESAQMSKEEVNALLFQPGFSTAATATDLSGRGVGLDVVKTAVEELNGTVTLESEPGRGTTFILKIPQLSAVNITDALTVKAQGTYYAIPIESVLATLEVKEEQITNICKNETIQYYEKVIAIYDLVDLLEGRILEQLENNPRLQQHLEQQAEQLAKSCETADQAGQSQEVDQQDSDNENLSGKQTPEPSNAADDIRNASDHLYKVVIVTHKTGTIGLKVDELLSPQKFVVFPWDDLYTVKGLLGSTIIGGNTLGLILNPPDLIDITLDTHGDEPEERQQEQQQPAEPKSDVASDVAANQQPVPSSDSATQDDEQDQVASRESMEKNKEFFFEIKALLTEVNDQIFKLEKNPNQVDLLHSIFRYLHSIKGDIVMMGFDEFASFVHDVETILDRIREKELEISEQIIDIFLDTVEELTRFVEMIGKNKVPGKVNKELAARIEEYKRIPEQEDAIDISEQDFILQPFEEFAVLSKKRAGCPIYQVYLHIDTSKQMSFILGYLILRKLAENFDILASFPRIADIEKGICSNNIKIFLSTREPETAVEQFIETTLKPYYDVKDYEILQTS